MTEASVAQEKSVVVHKINPTPHTTRNVDVKQATHGSRPMHRTIFVARSSPHLNAYKTENLLSRMQHVVARNAMHKADVVWVHPVAMPKTSLESFPQGCVSVSQDMNVYIRTAQAMYAVKNALYPQARQSVRFERHS